MICEPGARMTQQYELYGEEIGQCDWYLLSIEMQRMYMVFVSDTQNSMKIFSYGNITCDRETPKKVTRADK